MTNDELRLIVYIKRFRLDKTNRKPIIADQRFYAMGLLFYKFNWAEEAIGELLNKDRSSINYGKKKPYQYFEIEDDQFKEHCKSMIESFPFEFPKPIKHSRGCSKKVYHRLSRSREEKLLKFKNDCNLHNLNQAMNHLIDIYLN